MKVGEYLRDEMDDCCEKSGVLHKEGTLSTRKAWHTLAISLTGFLETSESIHAAAEFNTWR